jgi:enoyl-CoA hydratase
MTGFVRYRQDGAVVTITMDDGKVNALSPAMLADLAAAFDRAADQDGVVVVLEGRQGVFSAGFDLDVLRAGGPEATGMVLAGFSTAERILSFPAPVVISCGGHAVAMGLFLLLAGDYRIGARGAYTLAANEVAIGLTMPHTAVEILRGRLTPAAFQRAALLGEQFTPDTGVDAGVLDRVVDGAALPAVAAEVAAGLRSRLDLRAHALTKRRVRAAALTALRTAIAADAEVLHRRQRAAVLPTENGQPQK